MSDENLKMMFSALALSISALTASCFTIYKLDSLQRRSDGLDDEIVESRLETKRMFESIDDSCRDRSKHTEESVFGKLREEGLLSEEETNDEPTVVYR